MTKPSKMDLDKQVHIDFLRETNYLGWVSQIQDQQIWVLFFMMSSGVRDHNPERLRGS